MKKYLYTIYIFIGITVSIILTLLFTFFFKNETSRLFGPIIFTILSILSIYVLIKICENINDYTTLQIQNQMTRNHLKIQEEHIQVRQEANKQLEEAKNILHQQFDTLYKDTQVTNDYDDVVQDLLSKYMSVYQIDYCENKIIDAIIYNKMIIAKNNHIHLDIDIQVPNELTIHSLDLISVYTNLLDNAIEACLKVEEEKRYINVVSQIHKQYLIIKVTNSKTNESINKNQETTKNDKEFHGYGLKIIKKTCEKYKGVFTMNDHGDSVECNVTLYIGE